MGGGEGKAPEHDVLPEWATTIVQVVLDPHGAPDAPPQPPATAQGAEGHRGTLMFLTRSDTKHIPLRYTEAGRQAGRQADALRPAPPQPGGKRGLRFMEIFTVERANGHSVYMGGDSGRLEKSARQSPDL